MEERLLTPYNVKLVEELLDGDGEECPVDGCTYRAGWSTQDYEDEWVDLRDHVVRMHNDAVQPDETDWDPLRFQCGACDERFADMHDYCPDCGYAAVEESPVTCLCGAEMDYVRAVGSIKQSYLYACPGCGDEWSFSPDHRG